LPVPIISRVFPMFSCGTFKVSRFPLIPWGISFTIQQILLRTLG
jgi:hypothetical protein